MITSEVLGMGSYGEVKVAKLRGYHVAAKCLHQQILSEYNIHQFKREMNISAKIRHPNLLLFMGATLEGEPIILTELLSTSLRKELVKRKLNKSEICSVVQDIAHGLSYLHQWKPHPIIHRDISSGNVLLESLSNGWRAKVSDYGSANFMNLVSTKGPGCLTYAAPEAEFPKQQTPKMDVYSFGVLLMEMCVGEFPGVTSEEREAQIKRIHWPAMVSLLRRCIEENLLIDLPCPVLPVCLLKVRTPKIRMQTSCKCSSALPQAVSSSSLLDHSWYHGRLPTIQASERLQYFNQVCNIIMISAF